MTAWPISYKVMVSGVRDRNTKPKLRAAVTRAPSSGDCAWYTSSPLTSHNFRGISIKFHSKSLLLHIQWRRYWDMKIYLRSLWSSLPSFLSSGMTVWQSANRRKNSCTRGSSSLMASIKLLSWKRNFRSISGLKEKSTHGVFYKSQRQAWLPNTSPHRIMSVYIF